MHKKLLLRLSISLGLVCSSTNAIAQAITDDLVSYHRLEKNYKDTSGSTNSHHGTVNKAPAFKGAGAIGHCVEFRDQSSPNMSINLGDHADFDFGSNQDFTISIWFNRLGKMENNNDLGGGSTDATLISDKNWASGGNIGWGIFAASDGGVKFNISNGSTRRDKTIAAGFGSGGVADGQWHHLVVSVDRSGNAKFYIDGKAKGTLSLPSGNIHTGLPVVIGADGERNYPWGGKIDEVAIWRRAITAAEAKTIYDNREKGQAINGKTIVDNDNDGMDDDWEMSTFGALHHTADGDADNDGRANFLEYAQGTNANEASGTSIEISKVMHNNVEYPLISYTRPLLSSAASFHLERTTNFTLWEGGDQQFIAHGTPQDMGAGIKKYSYRYHEPTTTTDKFFRLRVAKSFPEAQSDKVNPTIEFRAGSAFIRWTTKEPTPTILEYGRAGQLVSRYENYTLKTSHEVEIENVQHGETIVYRVIHLKDGQETVSATMESNTVWDYSPPAIPDQGGYVTPGGWANTANTILSLPDAPQKGYCLDYGCGDGKLAYELVRQSDLVILAIEDTQAEVDAARAFLTARGVYGSRVTVVLASNLADTPALEDTYNLVVSQQQIANSTSYNTLKTNTSDYAIQEHGMIAGKDSTIIRGEFKAAKGGIDVWKNQYGNTDNSGSNEDELGNKSSFNDFELKWIGRPGAEIVIDRMVRAPSPLSAGGVFYCQGMGRILALDAHNGSVLWTRDIRDVRRLNMIRDSSNMTATDDGLLMAVKDECWQLDKYTGKRSAVSVIDGPRNDFEYYWGFVANEGGHLLGSAVKKGSFYKDYWGQTYWYDAQSGGETYQVCSDNLFAMNPTNGQQANRHERAGARQYNCTQHQASIGAG